MKELFNLLDSYFKNDNDIEISYFENEKNKSLSEILIEINEKRNIRELRIFNRNEFIYINDFSYENEINDNSDLKDYEIELFRINSILYELKSHFKAKSVLACSILLSASINDFK